jgi:hypothetical protein
LKKLANLSLGVMSARGLGGNMMGKAGLAPSCQAFAAQAKFVSVRGRRFQCIDNPLTAFF